MTVTPLPGVDRKMLLDSLRSILDEANEARELSTSSSYQWLLSYLGWAGDAMTKLGRLLRPGDIDRLILTKHYETLVSLSAMQPSNLRAAHLDKLIVFELEQRMVALSQVIQELSDQFHRWSFSDRFVVADSSFYIHHPDKLEDVDLAELLSFYDGPIHLILPMVVVDELDSLKQSKDARVRWRAGHTLAVLDRILQSDGAVNRLRDPDPERQRRTGVRCGEINVDILFDPSSHIRLPINDEEIIDRTLAVKTLVGRQVTLLTYDTGQATRARRGGLDVMKLAQPVAPLPETPTQGKKA